MKIDAIRSEQNGHGIFSAKMTVAELAQVAEVDFADPGINRTGYQRKPNEKRYDQIASYMIGKKAIMPPPIIMSYRGKLALRPLKGGFVEIEIPDDEKLWVIDGQHRLGGLKLLAGIQPTQGTGRISKKFQKYNADYQGFEMPVVIIECSSVAVEAAQFATINSEAKKVDKYLANVAILKGGGDMPTGERAWEPRAADAVHHLNTSDESMLFEKIKHSNAAKGNYYCSAKGLMMLMKPIMNDGIYSGAWEKGGTSRERLYKMLTDYWAAWNEVIPFCFVDPKNHALFKNSGLTAVNVCLVTMIRRIGAEYPSKQQFISVISKLGEYVEEQFWHKNGRHPANLYRCVGASQSRNAARLMEEAIVEVRISGAGKSSTR
jgi:DGQHR domain-containing protein